MRCRPSCSHARVPKGHAPVSLALDLGSAWAFRLSTRNETRLNIFSPYSSQCLVAIRASTLGESAAHAFQDACKPPSCWKSALCSWTGDGQQNMVFLQTISPHVQCISCPLHRELLAYQSRALVSKMSLDNAHQAALQADVYFDNLCAPVLQARMVR